LPAKISTYFSAIQVGLGEKLAQIVYSISMITGGLIIAFVRGGVFALACFVYIPVFMIISKYGIAQIKKTQI
jgi:hypothetical protein